MRYKTIRMMMRHKWRCRRIWIGSDDLNRIIRMDCHKLKTYSNARKTIENKTRYLTLVVHETLKKIKTKAIRMLLAKKHP